MFNELLLSASVAHLVKKNNWRIMKLYCLSSDVMMLSVA